MTTASNKVPTWVCKHLGRDVRLAADHEDAPRGKVGKLLMIDSGIVETGKWRGRGSTWRWPSTPYAVVAFDELDLGVVSNVDFAQLEPIPS